MVSNKQAADLVRQALSQGKILHFRNGFGDFTAGPNITAVPGSSFNAYSMNYYGRNTNVQRSFFGDLDTIAWRVVDHAGRGAAKQAALNAKDSRKPNPIQGGVPTIMLLGALAATALGTYLVVKGFSKPAPSPSPEPRIPDFSRQDPVIYNALGPYGVEVDPKMQA